MKEYSLLKYKNPTPLGVSFSINLPWSVNLIRYYKDVNLGCFVKGKISLIGDI